MLTYGSLFSGYGGFDLALQNAGMSPSWQCEIEPACNRVLRRHWPELKRFDDVRSIKPIRSLRVDVLCGGFPCQDLSVAGRRAGLAGERSGLFFEFMRLVESLAPRWVLVENVPGLLSSNGGRDMGAVVGTLAKLGYGWAYRVLDAQWFGVPQQRRRVFIVGCAGADSRRAAEVLFERESLPWDSAPSREAGARTALPVTTRVDRGGQHREAHGNNIVNCLDRHMGAGGVDDNAAQAGHIVSCLDTKPYADHESKESRLVTFAIQERAISESDTSGPGGKGYQEGRAFTLEARHHCQAVAHTLRSEGADASEDGTGRGTPIIAATLRSRQHRPGVSAPGRGGEDDQNLVIRSGVRRLTPRECERLQGLPDDWTRWGDDGEQLSDSARYRMIGNGVAIPVVEWIARRVLEAMQPA